MAVRRIEDQKIENEETKKVDPFTEPTYVTDEDILGIAWFKRSDAQFAKYSQDIVKDEETGLKFNIAVTKTRR